MGENNNAARQGSQISLVEKQQVRSKCNNLITKLNVGFTITNIIVIVINIVILVILLQKARQIIDILDLIQEYIDKYGEEVVKIINDMTSTKISNKDLKFIRN